MTDLWILCTWDGWVHVEGEELFWSVDDQNNLTIYEKQPKIHPLCIHAHGSWLAVRTTEFEH